ncbi:AfsR/SARP family transcriptional regulator [Amycolatopsis sp. lyj-23]|uniref:AfsR/SARP family transcriptional regulator n=1 Tax=Amycolatopsis sp. lyj-23 TaxID=2789283 RepID=UPI00397844DF
MELRLLGPVELVADAGPVDLGGPRQRTVLSVLALNKNRVTPVARLVDAVWGATPPSTARSQVQICISGLRKVLDGVGAAAAIQTQAPGYLLELDDAELDSARFARMVAEARELSAAGKLAQASGTLRGALALWRGAALTGIDSDVVRRDAVLLEDHRMAAEEERLRIDLELGRHEEISGELRALVEAQPLREKLHSFLMLALYRSGRQAEALQVFRRARTVLVDEVGVEPGEELQELIRAILNRDPALGAPETTRAPVREPVRPPPEEPPPAVPRHLPAGIADFTGRDTQIAEIKDRLSGERDPFAVRIVSIAGRGGVGKSSLAIRIAHELGDAYPDGHLYADLREPGDDRTPELHARFLRALGVLGTAVPEDRRERAEMYRTRTAGKRLLVVLDDVADEEQVLPLLPGSPSCAVIVTSRARLSGLSGAHSVDVDVFDAGQALELLVRIIGPDRVAAEREAAVELVDFCDGLPLALRIAGARLASRPHWRIGDLVRRLGDEAGRLDELAHRGIELRSNIALTYHSLDARGQRLFRLIALVEAPDFPAWTAAALLDTDLLAASEVLESLVDAQVLDTVVYPGEHEVRYRFHDLIRVYARERLLESETGEDRHEALTRLLGGWLELAEDAHRKDYGGDYTVLHGDAPRWRPPGEAVPVNPLVWWETERRAVPAAIRQAAAAGLDELCWDLALTSVTMFEAKGYFDEWHETSRLALELAERAGNDRGRAAMLYSLGSLHLAQRRLEKAEECFAEALTIFARQGADHGRALVLRNAAFIDWLRRDRVASLRKYDEALDLMRAAGDRIGAAHVLCNLARIRIDDGAESHATHLLDEALAISRHAGCLRVEAQVLYRFTELHLQADKIDLARAALHRVLRIVRQIGDRVGEAYALHGLGLVRYREGRLDNAEATLAHALVAAHGVGELFVEARIRFTLGEIAQAKGDDEVAQTQLSTAAELFEQLESAVWQAKSLVLLSEIHVAGGDANLAQKEAEQAARLLPGPAVA